MPAAGSLRTSTRARRAERFAAVTAAITRRLPFGLARILGVGAGLAALGVDYRLARIVAGICEAVYMYAAMRWLVFRDVNARDPGAV